MSMGAGVGRWIKGYLQVDLTGREPERFLNLCRNREIELWDIRAVSGGCCGFISVEGFRRVREPLRKSAMKVRIRKKYGFPFFLYRNRKRKLFFAGLAAGVTMLFGLSFFIWDIRVEGNRMYTDDTLIRYLEAQEIRCGMRKDLVDCEDLEESLRADFPEITWVSAQVSGTRLMVKIKENEALSSVPDIVSEPCDIVAAADGIITDMIVRSGTAQVSVGDTVAAGDVLISGRIPITDDGGNVTTEHLVRADGDVTVRTTETYGMDYGGWKTVETATGRNRTGVFLRVGNWSVRLMLPGEEETAWRVWEEERQLSLTDHFCLPVWWGMIRAKEYTVHERRYTEEEKEEIRQQTSEGFAEKMEQKGVQIEENNARIIEKSSGFSIEGKAVFRRPAGEARRIVSEETPAAEENDRTA